jgi:hypothetical protein
MTITIKDDDNTSLRITLTDERMNNDNYVEMTIQNDDNRIDFTAGIDELASAIKAFTEQRKMRLERETLMK